MAFRIVALVATFCAVAAGQQWSRLADSSSPPAVDVVAACYDSDRQRTVCVTREVDGAGGGAAAGRMSTWERHDGQWLLRDTGGTGPTLSATADFQLAYHPLRRRAVLCNGLGETWSYDGATWARITSANVPNAQAPSLTWDAARSVLVLFDAGQFFEFDESSASWQARGPLLAVQNFVLRRARIAFDPVAQSVLLFGGQAGPFSTSPTVRWDGAGHTQLFPATVPQPRTEHQLTADPISGRLVLTGGVGATGGPFASAIADVHEWSGSDWVAAPSLPVPVAFHGAARTDRDQLVLHGGASNNTSNRRTLLRSPTAVWRDATPSGPLSTVTQAVFVPGLGLTVAHDGASTTLLFDGFDWATSVAPSPPAPAGGRFALGWHAITGVVRLDGLDMWRFDGSGWSYVTSTPTALGNGVMAYDAASARLVLYLPGDGQPGSVGNDTWLWDGMTWTLLPTTATPPADAAAAMCLSPTSGRPFLVTAGRAYEFDGAGWNLQGGTLPSVAAPRMLAADPVFGVVLVGTSASAPFTSVAHRYDGSTWHALPAPNPTPVFGPLVFHPARGGVVLHDTIARQDLLLTGTPATATTYGAGCGSAPVLAAANEPDLGAVFVTELRGLPAAAPTFVLADFAASNQPIPGTQGCVLLVQAPVVVGATVASPGGFADVEWSIPRTGALRGVHVFEQALALTVGGAFFGFADVSAGLDVAIGG